MTLPRRLLAAVLKLTALSVLLLGSCAGPAVLYVQSPRWFVEPFDPDKAGSFFIVFHAQDAKGHDGLRILPLSIDPERRGYRDIRYQLSETPRLEPVIDGDTRANVEVFNQADGSQIIRALVRSESPWSSLSEYRVKDNTVEPLRQGHAVGWLLAGGLVFCLVLVHFVMKPVRRHIEQMTGLEKNDPASPSHSKNLH